MDVEGAGFRSTFPVWRLCKYTNISIYEVHLYLGNNLFLFLTVRVMSLYQKRERERDKSEPKLH